MNTKNKTEWDGTHKRRSPSRAEGRLCQRWENKILPSLKNKTGIAGELRLKGDGMLIRSRRTEKCNENVMGNEWNSRRENIRGARKRNFSERERGTYQRQID